MQILRQDLRYGVRMLAKKPLFTVIAVVTLALGIGANTAIFSVVNAVLLRALPYHNSDQLVVLAGVAPSGDRDVISVLEAEDFKSQMQSLEDLTVFQTQSVNLTGGERPDRVRGAFVSANFFKVFNLAPVVGRTFVEGEDRQGGAKLAVINEKMWQERLNGDKNLEAKRLILNGEPYSVIGVVPTAFKEPFDADVEVWMPVANFPGNTGQREARFDLQWAISNRVISCHRLKQRQRLCEPTGAGISKRKCRTRREGGVFPRTHGCRVYVRCSGCCLPLSA